jgi:hypothetical protein
LRREDDIKMNVTEIGSENENWVEYIQVYSEILILGFCILC